MFKLLMGLLHHVIRVVTFRHDGTGLPDRHGPVLTAIVALFLIVAAQRWMGFRDVSLATFAATQVPFLLIVVGLMRAKSAAILLLSSVGVDMVAVLLYMGGLNPGEGTLRWSLFGWELTAFVCSLVAMAAKAREV